MRKLGQFSITFPSWYLRGKENVSFSDNTVLKSPEMALPHLSEASSPPLLSYKIIRSSIKAFHSSFGEAAGAKASWYFGQNTCLIFLDFSHYSREKEEGSWNTLAEAEQAGCLLKGQQNTWFLGKVAPPRVSWETCPPPQCSRSSRSSWVPSRAGGAKYLRWGTETDSNHFSMPDVENISHVKHPFCFHSFHFSMSGFTSSNLDAVGLVNPCL